MNRQLSEQASPSSDDVRKLVPLRRLQQRLAIIWGVTSILGFVLLLALTPRFGSATVQGWGWFSQTFTPLLGIVVTGVIAAQQSDDRRVVTHFFASFTTTGLTLYGLVALITPLLVVLVGTELMEWLQTSAVWLGIGQSTIAGLVTFSFRETKDLNGMQKLDSRRPSN